MRGIWTLIGKTAAAAAAMGFICWRTNVQIEVWPGIENLIARSVGVFVPIGISVVVFVSIAKLLKIRELSQLINAVARRR